MTRKVPKQVIQDHGSPVYILVDDDTLPDSPSAKVDRKVTAAEVIERATRALRVAPSICSPTYIAVGGINGGAPLGGSPEDRCGRCGFTREEHERRVTT